MGHPAQLESKQLAESAAPLQVQAVVVAVVQPLAATAHVCRLAPDKHVVPTVQAFVQHEAAPAAPVHAPLVQVAAEAWYRHT
jgi:hypothetical protein